MVDLHTHILPGVDDGSKGMEQSLEMLRRAADQGFDMVVLTPHYMSYTQYASSFEANAEIFIDLQRKARYEGIPVSIFLGNEVFYAPEILNPEMRRNYIGLNKTRYLLVETTRREANPDNFMQFLYMLQIQGMTPIIAHPERYDFVQKDPEVLFDLLDKGSLLQMNVLSLTGFYGKRASKTASYMLSHRLMQFMATDAHQPSFYDGLPKALFLARKTLGGADFREIMTDNPTKVLCNRTDIPIKARRTDPDSERKRRWGLFGRKKEVF